MHLSLSRKNLWERTPPFLKGLLGQATAIIPMSHLLGARFRAHLAFAQEAQWWSADRAREYQLTRIREICLLAYEKTDYYRETFRQAGFTPGDLKSLEDFSSLPTIDKETIRTHMNSMCAVPDGPSGVDYVATGGSSGEPLRFLAGSDRSAVEFAYLVASWERAGYRLGLPLAVFRGQVVRPRRNGLRHEYDPLLRRHYYSNFHRSAQDIRRYLEHIATLGPCYLLAYPSSVYTLARFLEETEIPAPPNLRGILAGSENVYPSDRMDTESTFGLRFFSWYGHSEKLVLAAECERSADYHVWPTYGYFELLDPDGKAVTTPGERGEIVGTGFINTVMPFIRYRTGDYAVLSGQACKACGREQTLLSRIDGRWPQGDLTAKDGSPISMTAFNVHDDTFEATHGYQFFQSEPGRAVLRVVPARALTDRDREFILSRVNARLQGQVYVTLEVRSELQLTPSGKQLRVVRAAPPSSPGSLDRRGDNSNGVSVSQ
jgi:phenylacetate-CoA ligase